MTAPTPADRIGVAQVATAACMWGSWSLFLRGADVSPWLSAPVVFCLMGAFTLPLATGARPRAAWDRSTVALLVAHSALAAGNLITYFAAIAHTTLAVAVLTHYLAPVFVAIAAPVIDRERVAGAPAAALGATAGLLLILEPWAGADGRGELVIGALLGTASAICYAGNVFLARRLEPRIGARRIIAYHGLIAGLLLVPTAGSELAGLTLPALGWLALGAAVPGAVAGVLFVTGLGRIGSARAAILAYFEPLVAVILGWLVWGESLRLPALTGAALIVAAGAWVARDRS